MRACERVCVCVGTFACIRMMCGVDVCVCVCVYLLLENHEKRSRMCEERYIISDN